MSSEVWEGRLILAEETLQQLSGSLALLPLSRDSGGRNWAQPGWEELVSEEGRVRASELQRGDRGVRSPRSTPASCEDPGRVPGTHRPPVRIQDI